MKEVECELIRELKKHNFIIQRYSSKTTKSIYIKLDYGMCNSIRISDHPGKKKYSFRYNILVNIDRAYKIEEPSIQYFFSPIDIEFMVALIVADRKEKIEKYGFNNYLAYRDRNRDENKGKEGFWKLAKLV